MEQILVINHQIIKLIITQELGFCAKCQQESQTRLLVQRNDDQKHYCQNCSLNLLDQLTQSNYQFTSKETIIKELRDQLTKKLWVDYYSAKKPTCFNCVKLGIKEIEYRFCGDGCLVASYLQYHGQHYLKKQPNSYENLWKNN